MKNILPSMEASIYHTIVEDLRHSKAWPKKAGSFAVPAAFGTHFANKIEDGLRREFKAYTEVTCTPSEPGFTKITYSVDYTYVQPEISPQRSDILTDPAIEVAS